MKFSIKDFFSKCNQIHRKLRMWSHLLKKSLIENFSFCPVILGNLLVAWLNLKGAFLFRLFTVYWDQSRTYWSSHQRCSVKKVFLKISQNWQESTCARVSLLTKLQAFFSYIHFLSKIWPATLLKKRLWRRYFPVNFAKFLKTSFSQNTSRRVLLYLGPYGVSMMNFLRKCAAQKISFPLSIYSVNMTKSTVSGFSHIYWRNP